MSSQLSELVNKGEASWLEWRRYTAYSLGTEERVSDPLFEGMLRHCEDDTCRLVNRSMGEGRFTM